MQRLRAVDRALVEHVPSHSLKRVLMLPLVTSMGSVRWLSLMKCALLAVVRSQ